MLLEITDASVRRGGNEVLSHFSFEIKGTEKIAVVGRNGAGKTTLLEVLAGKCPIEKNEKNLLSGMHATRTYTVGMLSQSGAEGSGSTISERVLSLFMKGKDPEDLYSDERFDFEAEYDRMFCYLGFDTGKKRKRFCEFSGGEQRKIMMIELLLEKPDILILDEPTNHLDLAATEWLEAYIKDYPKTVVLVSHDRFFIDKTADVVWEVTGKKLVRYSGNYTDFRKEKAQAYKRQLKAYEAQQEEIQRLERLIETFKHKPKKAAFARSRKKILERMEIIEEPVKDEAVIHTGDIVPLRRGSKIVYQCEKLKIGYERPVKELSFRIRKGQKIGIIGPNGAGKSTFLKTVAGKLKPLSGKSDLGTNIDLAYFDQLTGEFSSEKIIIEWFHDQYPALSEKDVRNILAGYLFTGRDMGRKVSSLSGGEKARLMLSAILQTGPNFLVLDEPTNNMDIPAKETLESLFRSYKGTILFVTHDRYFLSEVADSLLIFETGTETVNFYPFSYRHYCVRRVKDGSGEELRAMRTAEEQRLIDGLKAVPGKEKGMLKVPSSLSLERDWKFGLNDEKRAKAEAGFEAVWKEIERYPETEEEYNEDSRHKESLMQNAEVMLDKWTDACLEWYEIWQEFVDNYSEIAQ